MKRLNDSPAEDRLTSRAQVLIRAIGPTVESEERLRRVRRSLDTPAGAAAPRWVWRAGLAVGALALSAAAAVGISALTSVEGAPQTVGNGAPPRLSPSPGAAASVATPSPLPVENAVEAAPSAAPAGSSTPTKAPASRVGVLPISDVARVHEAAKALRHEGDAQRALQLLEHGSPVTGPLAEEALALRIEASVASGNGRQAKLATAYLAQYPQGRYRELAQKALSGSER